MVHQELKQIYTNRVIRKIGIGLISIFVPIFMLTLGYQLTEIFGYMIVYFIFNFIFQVVTAEVQSRTGIKKTTLAGIVFGSIFYIFLLTLKQYHWPFWLLGMISGTGSGFYFQSTQSLLNTYNKKRREGKEASYLILSNKIAGIFVPLISALLIVLINFEFVTYIALGIYFLSIIPLYFSKDVKISTKKKWKEVFSLKHWKYILNFVTQGLHDGISQVIPLLIYILSAQYILVGGFESLITAFTLGTIYLAGKVSDKFKKIKIIKIGFIISSIGWLMLFLNTDAIGFLIASIIIGIGNPFAGVSVFSYACEYSKKNKDIPKFQALREFGLNLGRIITITTVMFFSFEIAFLIPIIGTIIFLFLIKE